MSNSQQYITHKLEGVNSLCSYLKNNKSVSRQLDELLRYFPMFDIERGGAAYSFQVCNGFSKSWEKIMYTVIILHSDQVIGYGQLLLRKSFAEIFNVVVHPQYRKQGIGKEIIVELEDYAVTHNKFEFSLWCENPIKLFYTQFGYAHDGKEQIVEEVQLYHMAKLFQKLGKRLE